MACATSSLPEPFSPVISTRPCDGATRRMLSIRVEIAALAPTMPRPSGPSSGAVRRSGETWAACYVTSSKCSRSGGFTMKSNAPRCPAFMAFATVPSPDTTMTAVSCAISRILGSASSPLMPGIARSSSTTATAWVPSDSSARSPLSASTTLCPASSSTARSASRIAGLSSTTINSRPALAMCVPFRGRFVGKRRGARIPAPAGARQHQRGARTPAFAVLEPDRSSMLQHDVTYQRQSEPAAAALGAHIRLEQPWLQVGGDPGAAVQHLEHHAAVAGAQLDLDRRARGTRLARIEQLVVDGACQRQGIALHPCRSLDSHDHLAGHAGRGLHHGAHDLAQIQGLEPRLRQPGVLRELLRQPAQVI